MQFALDFIAERGERIGALITFRDAESVRRIENEFELSRRLAAIGRLTSGVAHEVKNPINAIVVHLEILKNKLQEVAPDAQRHMDIIGNEIRRLDRVVQTLVDFTRPVDLKLGRTDLRKLAEEVALLAGPEAESHNVKLEFSGACSFPAGVRGRRSVQTGDSQHRAQRRAGDARRRHAENGRAQNGKRGHHRNQRPGCTEFRRRSRTRSSISTSRRRKPAAGSDWR